MSPILVSAESHDAIVAVLETALLAAQRLSTSIEGLAPAKDREEAFSSEGIMDIVCSASDAPEELQSTCRYAFEQFMSRVGVSVVWHHSAAMLAGEGRSFAAVGWHVPAVAKAVPS